MSPLEKVYQEAFEFLFYWYQARPYSSRSRSPEEIAIRAALHDPPHVTQRVKVQLKSF
jgi:hypothetical protein